MQREDLAYGHMSFASRDPVLIELGPSAHMPRGGWLAALRSLEMSAIRQTTKASNPLQSNAPILISRSEDLSFGGELADARECVYLSWHRWT